MQHPVQSPIINHYLFIVVGSAVGGVVWQRKHLFFNYKVRWY